MENETYFVYYNARKNKYIIISSEEEENGKKVLDLLLKGYTTLKNDAASYEEAEEFILEYIYRHITTFSIQRGFDVPQNNQERNYE